MEFGGGLVVLAGAEAVIRGAREKGQVRGVKMGGGRGVSCRSALNTLVRLV